MKSENLDETMSYLVTKRLDKKFEWATETKKTIKIRN